MDEAQFGVLLVFGRRAIVIIIIWLHCHFLVRSVGECIHVPAFFLASGIMEATTKHGPVSGIQMPGQRTIPTKNSSRVSQTTTEELLTEALRRNAETEAAAQQTRDRLGHQGEQLSGAQTRLEGTQMRVVEARGVLLTMRWRIFKEKLWLWLLVLALCAVDAALAYRLFTNDGRLGKN